MQDSASLARGFGDMGDDPEDSHADYLPAHKAVRVHFWRSTPRWPLVQLHVLWLVFKERTQLLEDLLRLKKLYKNYLKQLCAIRSVLVVDITGHEKAISICTLSCWLAWVDLWSEDIVIVLHVHLTWLYNRINIDLASNFQVICSCAPCWHIWIWSHAMKKADLNYDWKA